MGERECDNAAPRIRTLRDVGFAETPLRRLSQEEPMSFVVEGVESNKKNVLRNAIEIRHFNFCTQSENSLFRA